jgi:hypothetical protein
MQKSVAVRSVNLLAGGDQQECTTQAGLYQQPRSDHGYPPSPHEHLTLEDTVGGTCTS